MKARPWSANAELSPPTSASPVTPRKPGRKLARTAPASDASARRGRAVAGVKGQGRARRCEIATTLPASHRLIAKTKAKLQPMAKGTAVTAPFTRSSAGMPRIGGRGTSAGVWVIPRKRPSKAL
jgi:hypothetical protein